ncbi:MAG: hypothetical protein HY080_04780 [Gammaproteobacteria bacterium]|nr:hypothetical protein [Gammaproteobacteria bacterium]
MSDHPPVPRVIPARSSRAAARLFNYGNLSAILLPIPLGILWFGASIVVYAMNRHHPNPRVGHYTQQAAYRFYGLLGLTLVVGTFFSTGFKTWLITWGVVVAILLPWTLWDLWRIQQENWHDTNFTTEEPSV